MYSVFSDHEDDFPRDEYEDDDEDYYEDENEDEYQSEYEVGFAEGYSQGLKKFSTEKSRKENDLKRKEAELQEKTNAFNKKHNMILKKESQLRKATNAFHKKRRKLENQSRENNILRIEAERTKSVAIKDSKGIYEELKKERQKNIVISIENKNLKEILRKLRTERDDLLILNEKENIKPQNSPVKKRKLAWEPQLSLTKAKRSRNYRKRWNTFIYVH